MSFLFGRIVMAEITVVNKYYGVHGKSIMRGTIFGNPYSLQKGYTREEAITLYREWLRDNYRRKMSVYFALIKLVERLESGENVVLVCCCKPKACHGDVIVEAVNGIMRTRPNKSLHTPQKTGGKIKWQT